MNIVMNNTTVDKLVDPGKGPSTNKQDNLDNGSNVITVEDLVEVEVTKENERVENME